MIPSIVLYIIDHCIQRYHINQSADVLSISKNGDVIRLQLKKDGFKFTPGQYVFLCIPAISFLQWHPFTISSPPNLVGNTFVIYCKALGSFTNSMLSTLFPRAHPNAIIDIENPDNLTILVDGPYGHLGIKPLEHEVVVLVSGGVGVTPMLSTLQYIYFKMLSAKTTIRTKKVYFIYSVKTIHMFELFEGIFTEIKKSKVADRFSFYIHVTSGNVDTTRFIKGRAKYDVYFNKFKQTHADVKRIACYVCGPNEMVHGVWDMCYYHSSPFLRFEFHKETFEF